LKWLFYTSLGHVAKGFDEPKSREIVNRRLLWVICIPGTGDDPKPTNLYLPLLIKQARLNFFHPVFPLRWLDGRAYPFSCDGRSRFRALRGLVMQSEKENYYTFLTIIKKRRFFCLNGYYLTMSWQSQKNRHSQDSLN
jgi:hypothetical protein